LIFTQVIFSYFLLLPEKKPALQNLVLEKFALKFSQISSFSRYFFKKTKNCSLHFSLTPKPLLPRQAAGILRLKYFEWFSEF